MCRWTLADMRNSPLTAGGEQARERGRRLPLHGIVDVPLFLPALDEPGPPEQVEVVRQGRARDLHGRLDLAHRDFPPGADEEEEHLESGQVPEGLERLDVGVIGLQPGQRQAGYSFHSSKFMKLSNGCQADSSRLRVLTAPGSHPTIASFSGGLEGCECPGTMHWPGSSPVSSRSGSRHPDPSTPSAIRPP